jgi:hypothetical protein
VKDLLEMIVKAIVDHTDQIQITVVEGERVIVVELRVHPEDMGYVIGTDGRMAEALRTILSCVGMKARKRVSLGILD